MKGLFQASAEFGEGYLGSAWSGLFVPVQQVTDLYDSYKEFMTGEPAIVRDSSAEPLAGATKRRFPEGGSNMPEVELATRGAPPVREKPLLRQGLGLTVKSAKNPAEETFDRLQFTRGDILPTTGVKAWDAAVAHEMGPVVEDVTSKYVQSPAFLRLSDNIQEGYLREHLRQIAAAARKVAARKHPKLAAEAAEKRLPKWKRRAIKDLNRQAEERQKRLEANQ